MYSQKGWGMAVRSCVLQTILKNLPNKQIDRLVEKYEVDHYVKDHHTVNDLHALIFFHIDEEKSLTELVDNLRMNSFLMHVCGYDKPISLSQFSRDNKNTEPEFYFEIFQKTVEQARKLGIYRPLKKLKKYVIGYDGMFIELNPEVFNFAKQGYCPVEKGVRWGAKVHIALNAGIIDAPPITIRITPGNVHDSKMFETLESDVLRIIHTENIIFIQDAGYTSLKRIQRWLNEGRLFIIPLHKNLTKRGRKVKTLSPYKGTGKGDYVFRHPALDEDLRLIVYRRNGKKFKLLTNIWNYKPSTIVEIFRKRWDCEVLNKEMKQHFRIKKPIGLSWNALCIQIITAYISYLLLLIVKALFRMGGTFLKFKRYVSINWWEPTPLPKGVGPPEQKEISPVRRMNLQRNARRFMQR
jgi:hypothetical protein